MSVITFEDSQTYVLPLDSLDLTYYSKHFCNKETTVPLWNLPRLNGETELFHVKIVAQNVDEEECYIESLDTYKCHICNVDVPNIYYKEHNESKKHETNKKISEKILERVAKQMSIYKTENENYSTKNIYYCSPCSRAIEFKNKYKHEASDYHKMCEEKMKILKDFYNKCIETESPIIGMLENEYSNDNIIKHNEEDKYTGDIEDFEFCSVFENNESRQDLNLESQISNPQTFDEYLKEMIAKYNLCVPKPLTEDDNIIIVPSSGDRIKISATYFHSYKFIKNNVYCQVCQTWISKNCTAHEITETHVRRIFLEVNEKYARRIDTISSHCLVCNEVILTDSDHQKLSDDHKLNFNKANIDNKVTKEFCSICNIYIDSHNLTSHINSKKHNTNENYLMLPCKNINKIDSNKYFCNSCNLNLNVATLKNHIEDSSHNETDVIENKDLGVTGLNVGTINGLNVAERVIETLTNELRNGINVLKDYFRTEFTKSKAENKKIDIAPNPIPTNTLIPSSTNKSQQSNKPSNSDLATNVENINHNTTKVNNQYILLLDIENEHSAKCKVCSVYVPFNDSNIQTHMEGTRHSENMRTNYYCYLKSNENDTVKCRICDVDLKDNMIIIYQHFISETHSVGLKSLLNFHCINPQGSKYNCTLCNVSISNYFEHIHFTDHTNKYLSDLVIDKKLMRNYVYTDLSSGVEANIYRELYKNLLDSNCIVKLGNGQFYCRICCVKMTRITEIYHVLGERHLSEKEDNS